MYYNTIFFLDIYSIMSLNNMNCFKKYDLLVVSPGGSCQTILMNLISGSNNKLIMNPISDDDNLKHLSSYENSVFNCNEFEKVIYVYRHPLLVINSHFRRNWYKMQYKKISNFSDYNSGHLFDNKDDLFNTCLKENKDISNTSQHLDNWIKYPGKIYFIDISKPNEEELVNFLGFKINNLDKIAGNTKYENKKEVIEFFEKIHNENLVKIKNRNVKSV